MNNTNIAYLCCIRSFLSFKTNALWFIVLFIFIYKNSNNKDKLAYIKQMHHSFQNPPETNVGPLLRHKIKCFCVCDCI